MGQSWITSSRITTSESIFEIESLIDNDGNVITFGHFSGILTAPNGEKIISYGLRDYFVIKYDQSGQFSWMRKFGGRDQEIGTGGIGNDIDGNIYITGGFKEFLKYSDTDSLESFGSEDIFMIKINEMGDVIWARNTGKGSTSQYSTDLELDNFGDILLSGRFNDSINIYNIETLYTDKTIPDIFYAKFDNVNGDLIWIKHGKSLNLPTPGIFETVPTNENYYFTGLYRDSIKFEDDTIITDKEFFNVFLMKTDVSGSIEWYRTIGGNEFEYSYALTLDEYDNIYIAGFSNSDTLYMESSNSQIVEVTGNKGDYDIFLAKYLSNGDLDWYKLIGGKGNDRAFAMEYFDSKMYVSGKFSDTLYWGGIMLTSKGISDANMFSGAVDVNGNFREANSYSGRNNSREESRGVFQNGDKLYTVMISNSDLLVIGDSIYTSDGLHDYIVLGVIGCLPISLDNIIVNDVNTCYGDSTGSLQILATGGFGSPYQYSIDNGLSYQPDVSYFPNLPAGDYPVVVIDQKNCAQEGPLVSIGQPDTLRIEVVSTADITNEADGSIVVAATGGTTPYTFTLLPDNILQGFGTYTFQPGDSGRYVIQVNDAKNCGPVETDSIDILDFYGVGFEDISDLKVRIYPNPSSQMITLEMPLKEAEVTLEIMSLTGQVVMSLQAYPSGGVLRENIDVSDLSKGMYMVRVNGQTLRSGIVVN